MRLTPTPTALTLPTLPNFTSPNFTSPTFSSVPSMSSPYSPETQIFYYTLAAQPPQASLAPSSMVSPVCSTYNVPPAVSPMSPSFSQPTFNPAAMSPQPGAISPRLSPSTPVATPDIMHLINYGDKDLGLLLSQRMELVWHGEFDRLFAQYFPHIWCLVPTFYPPGDSWRTFKDSAKVRFSCQDCGHGWTSMKGRVVFWFELNYSTNAGCVMFKLYGQQCQRCKTGKFEHAMWYPEEVVKVIGNVYNRVGQIYYGFVRPPLRIDRRVGKPRNQHNAELCQACKEGLCKEEWSFA